MIPGQVPHKHNRRFYILMTTVVVGALLIVMVLNDRGALDSLGLTGSSVGGIGDSATGAEDKGTAVRDAGDISFSLTYDSLPNVKEEKTSFSSAVLSFDEVKTKIKLNEEELALDGLEKAEMEIGGFTGALEFDSNSISLEGEAEKIKVNGIAISTKKTMKISFEDLVYNQLGLSEVGISAIELQDGSGQLNIGEKMGYVLEDTEKLSLDNFDGDLQIGMDNQSRLSLEGTTSSISVKGDYSLTLG